MDALVLLREKVPGTCQRPGCQNTWEARYPGAKYCPPCRKIISAESNKEARNTRRRARRAAASSSATP